MLRVALREAVGALGAERGVVGLVRGEDVELASQLGYPKDGLARWARFPLSISAPMSEAIRTRKPILCRSREERERRWPVAWGVPEAQSHALVVLPLAGHSTVLGALAVSFADERRFSRTEREFFVALAAQCGLALESVRSHQLESVARERTERLQRFTERLAPALTAADVIAVALDKIRVATRARAATFAEYSAETRTLAYHSYGLPRRLTARLGEVLGTSQSALLRAIETRTPVWISDRPAWEALYPQSASLFEGFARSMAVLPIAIGGTVFGAMEILFQGESGFASGERDFLLTIAGQAAQALDRARLYEEQRDIAWTLQRSLLPRSLPVLEGADLAAVYNPAGLATAVGGDFYDAFETPRGLMLVIGDVCGKGPQAAGLTSICRHTLRAASLSDPDAQPAALLALLNRVLLSEATDTPDFATIACVAIEKVDGKVLVSAARGGHPPMLVRRASRLVEAVQPSGPLLGVFEHARFVERGLELETGDLLFLYTDGVTEARSGGELLGTRPLRELLASTAGDGSSRDVLAAVEGLLTAFRGPGLPSDDVAMLVLRVEDSGALLTSSAAGVTRAPTLAADGPSFAPATTFELAFPAEKAQLAAFRAALRLWLDGLALDAPAAHDVVVALNEAVSNAVMHAYRRADRREPICVEASFRDGELAAVVVDRDLRSPRQTRRRDSGLGLTVMAGLAREVETCSTPSGTELHLRWSCSRATTG